MMCKTPGTTWKMRTSWTAESGAGFYNFFLLALEFSFFDKQLRRGIEQVFPAEPICPTMLSRSVQLFFIAAPAN